MRRSAYERPAWPRGWRVSVLLELSGVQAAYGTTRVLHGVDFAMERGEAIALFGRNGMGKSSAVKVVMGQLKPTTGVVSFLGREVTGARPHQMARLGIGLVP